MRPLGGQRTVFVSVGASSSEINLDNTLIVLHRGEIAFGQHRAFVQHGNLAAELLDESHIVFNHDQGMFAGQGLEEFAGTFGFVVGHTGHRFVEQQQLGFLHQQHADLQPLFLAVREQAGGALGLSIEADARDRLAGSLSHGQKQWLEIGMLLAQDPKLLLVDEPVAGMTDVETHQTAELLKEINKEKTVMVVEHDMTFVRELGVKVTCLHEGTVLAEGTIDQVSSNERVIEVYLGR